MRVDPTKVVVIVNWPRPNTVTEIRSFMGVVQYWRKLISWFSSIAAPLHALTSVKEFSNGEASIREPSTL